MANIDNNEDILDSRDVIDRIEELESLVEDNEADADEVEELKVLKELAAEAEGSPDWIYGEVLIRDDYFVECAKQFAEDCGMVPKESSDWPMKHVSIDWEAAAAELQADYMDVDFDGVTYWIRA